MAYGTKSPGMGQLWLWLDSGLKPVTRACFWSSLSLPSSMLASDLTSCVESWEQKSYLEFLSDSYTSNEIPETDFGWHLLT